MKLSRWWLLAWAMAGDMGAIAGTIDGAKVGWWQWLIGPAVAVFAWQMHKIGARRHAARVQPWLDELKRRGLR